MAPFVDVVNTPIRGELKVSNAERVIMPSGAFCTAFPPAQDEIGSRAARHNHQHSLARHGRPRGG